jgi:chromosome partitioning protein
MKVIAIANQKGGVAKTTTAINLASGLARRSLRTLLIDLDAQANATQSLPVPDGPTLTIYEVFNHEVEVLDAIYPVDENFDALASHIKLAKLEPQLTGAVDAYKLREVLDNLTYDYVIIDCPPSLGALTTNALVAATHVLVPVTASYYGLNAVADFMERLIRFAALSTPNSSFSESW